MMKRKGQAEILDGLILLVITAICSVTLIGISGNYGVQAGEKYDSIYKNKLAQNALLSLYHITYEKRSIMAAASNDLAGGDYSLPTSREFLERVLNEYHGYFQNYHFGFAILDHVSDSLITSDTQLDADSFGSYPKSCANAALTHPCDPGSDEMCYKMFQVCVWER
jgi:hypothetical protein